MEKSESVQIEVGRPVLRLSKYFPRVRSFLAGGLLSVAVISCGGGGGTVQNPTAPVPPTTADSVVPTITVPASVIPLQQINITVTNPIPGSVYSAMIDAGNGTLYPAPIEKMSETSLSIAAPPGAVSSTASTISLGAGIIRIAIGRPDSTGTVQYSSYQSIAIAALSTLDSSIPMGAPIIAVLQASKASLYQSSANLSLVANKTNYMLKADTQLVSAAETANKIDAMISAVQSIQSNPSLSIPWTSIGGASINLNAATITLLDQLAAAHIRAINILAAATPVATSAYAVKQKFLRLRAMPTQRDFAPDIKDSFDCTGDADCDITQAINNYTQLPNAYAQIGYRVGHIFGQITATTGGIIVAAGLLASAPVWSTVAAGATLAAAGFYVSTMFATTVGVIAQTSSDALLNGEASVVSLKGASSFFANQYADLAISTLVDGVGQPYIGDLGTDLVDTAMSAESSYEALPSLTDAAYADQSLPANGIPSSSFAISIQQSSGSTDISEFTVTTSPALANGTLELEVTDAGFGQVSSEEIAITNGQGIVGVSNDSGGSVRQISVYDPQGNATASLDYDFQYPETSEPQAFALVQPGAPPATTGAGSSGGSTGGGASCTLGLTLPNTLTFDLVSDPSTSSCNGITGCNAGGRVTVSIATQQTAYCPSNPVPTSGTATVDGLNIAVGVYAFTLATDCTIVDIQDIGSATGDIGYPSFNLQYIYGPCAGGAGDESNTWLLLFNPSAADSGTPNL